MSAERARLRWRCRRGTRELDQVFGGWLERCYDAATPAQRAAFLALLDAQDPDLWDWVMGHSRPSDPAQATLIDEIRGGLRL